MDVDLEARAMLDECVAVGQSARRVEAPAQAEPLRQALRDFARRRKVRVRTAEIDGVVVIARTDADLWLDDAATMRRKLTPN